jgi:hypothetical protein
MKWNCRRGFECEVIRSSALRESGVFWVRLFAARSVERVSAGLGAEVSDIRDGETGASTALAAEVRHVVAPPVDRNTWDLEGEEDDDGADGNARHPGRREDVVVLGPEGEVALLDVDPGEPGEGDDGPEVGKVVWRPEEGSGAEHNRVHLADPGAAGEELLEAEHRWALSARAKSE